MNGSHVLIAIPVLLTGGTEVQTLALARALRKNGCRVTVCCYHEHERSMVERFEALGAQVLLLERARGDGLLRLVLELRRVFREVRPDAIHVQYLAPGLAAVLAARLAGARRVIATVHAVHPSWKARLLLRAASVLCDAFQCVSQAVEAHWFGSSRIPEPSAIREWRGHYTMYNCVDADHVDVAAARAGRDRVRKEFGLAGPTIGVVGRLSPEKGHRYLLEAVPEILEHVPAARVLVVGDGALRQELVELASRLGIQEKVVWMGRRPHDEVLRLYAAMDILALPSLREGFGLVAAEAMALGIPVVASAVQGLEEVVLKETTGLLVPPGDSRQLAAAVVRVLKAPSVAERLGSAAEARVREHFSVDRFEKNVALAYAGVGVLPLPACTGGRSR